MRRILMFLVLAEAMMYAGCDKKHNVGDFPLKPSLTKTELRETMGSPTKEDAHWVAYALEDGTELRFYFLEGKPGDDKDKRTLSEATIYSSAGVRMKNVYLLHPPAATTSPASAPATAP